MLVQAAPASRGRRSSTSGKGVAGWPQSPCFCKCSTLRRTAASSGFGPWHPKICSCSPLESIWMCKGLCRSCPPSEDGPCDCCGSSLGTGTWTELEAQRPVTGTGPGPMATLATFFQSRRLMVSAGSSPLGVRTPGLGLQLGCVYRLRDLGRDTACLCFPGSKTGLTMPAFLP